MPQKVNSNEIKIEKTPAAHPFSDQIFDYSSSNLNSLSSNKQSNF